MLANVNGGLFQGVTLDSQGNLYGVTGGSGIDNGGTVFELTPHRDGKWTQTTIHEFSCSTDGCGPSGNLIFDAAGNIYGTTSAGGPNDGGTVYELNPSSGGWMFTALHDFNAGSPQDGAFPSGLVMDVAGNLYGVAGGGMYDLGVVYELTQGSGGWNEDVLYNFGSRSHDDSGNSVLTLDRAGNLYGTADYGANGIGAVFRLSPAGKETLLYNFCPGGWPCVDGAGPRNGVVFGPSGALYGTTAGGGAYACGETHCGTIFELRRAGNGYWDETVLHDFRPGAAGNDPSSRLSPDRAGNLYGTTGVGGIGGCPYGCGVVYELTKGAKGKLKYAVLHQFDGSDGSMPGGGLTLDDKDNLYGTAYGVVFKITP